MKKTLLKVVMAVAAIAMLASCSPKVSGTFSGTSTGMQGPVTVELTVADGKITAVNVTECHETPSLCEVALARIPAQIVEHQTTYVDTVTGATLCSNALINAAGKAAKEAGLDVEKMKKNAYHAKAGKDETFDTDVLVIGGGGAGLSAAIAAGQQGAKVILIEKGSVLGGNTMMAGGAFNCVDPEAQAGAKLSNAQKNTLDSYLKLSTSDKDLHFELFPEWAKVLTGLQDEITAFYAANKGKTLPGFDTINLHMWHIYTGGLRQMDNGSWVAPQYDLAYTLASHALESYDWTGSLGVATKSHAAASDSLYTVLGAMWPRTHAYTNGKPLIDKLREAAEKEGVVIYTEMAGKDLIMAGGKVAGAHAVRADGTKVTINAKKGVVLASGGYCANPAMVKEYDEYWGADLTNRTLTTNVGTNTGDGIVMAQAVGAATRDLGVSQLMPSSSPIKGTMTDGVWADASEQIWIDAKGNRFVNEYAERDVLAKASLKLDNGIFYILFAGSGMANPDKMCKGAAKEGGMFGTSITDMINNGHIWYGSTLKELAEASKKSAGGAAPAFTEEALRATIEKYNSYVDAQYDPDFGKEVLNGKIDIAAIEADPNVGFIISPRKSSLHHTMGGVSINTEAEVIDANGNAIPGLWAAGEVTGGVHAGNRLGGNAIADIFTFGLIAGRNAGK